MVKVRIKAFCPMDALVGNGYIILEEERKPLAVTLVGVLFWLASKVEEAGPINSVLYLFVNTGPCNVPCAK
jgi:hypothetical protein